MGAMYLPLEDTLYFAEAGNGAYRNGKKVRVTAQPDLQRVLCAFGFDPAPIRRSRRSVELLITAKALPQRRQLQRPGQHHLHNGKAG